MIYPTRQLKYISVCKEAMKDVYRFLLDDTMLFTSCILGGFAVNISPLNGV